MQTVIALTTAASATATAQQFVARGHFNALAGLTVFALAWMLTAGALRAWRARRDPSAAAG